MKVTWHNKPLFPLVAQAAWNEQNPHANPAKRKALVTHPEAR